MGSLKDQLFQQYAAAGLNRLLAAYRKQYLPKKGDRFNYNGITYEIGPPKVSNGTIESGRMRRDPLRICTGPNPRDGGAEMRVGVVPEFLDEPMAIERALDDSALHAAPAAVNQAYFLQAGGCRGVDVLLHE